MLFDMPVMNKINKAGSWLQTERKRRNWSQRHLAIKVGLTNTAVSDAEKGIATPRTWVMLAAFFEAPFDKILEWAEVQKDENIQKVLDAWDKAGPEERDTIMLIIRFLKL